MTDPKKEDPAPDLPPDRSAQARSTAADEHSLGDQRTSGVPRASARNDLTGQKFGLYTLEQLIGEGGQAAVYLARDEQGEPYAVKVMARVSMGGVEAEERLRREAQAMRSLRHDNIVAFYAFNLEGDWAWLAMQYVDGESLGQRVKQTGPLPTGTAIALLEDVLSGLGAAHRKQLVHRDLSANNVLIESESGQALLTDFGLAKGESLGASLTGTGTIVGTGA